MLCQVVSSKTSITIIGKANILFTRMHSASMLDACFISIQFTSFHFNLSNWFPFGAVSFTDSGIRLTAACVYVAQRIDVYWIGIVCDIEVVVRTLCAVMHPYDLPILIHTFHAHHTHTIAHTATLTHVYNSWNVRLPVFFARCSAIPSLSMLIFLHIPIRYWKLHYSCT